MDYGSLFLFGFMLLLVKFNLNELAGSKVCANAKKIIKFNRFGLVHFGRQLGWCCGWGFTNGGSKDFTNGGSVGHLKEWG